ncbi:MAG: invasion associated locus B family protein [Pseudomonadota bacterium]
MVRTISYICALALSLVGAAAIAQDSSTNRVDTKTDWNIFVENEPKSCWGVAPPKDQQLTRNGQPDPNARRDETLLMVSYIPSQSVNGQVSFTGGYPIAPGSTVTVTIGDTSVEMTTIEGEWAWADTSEDDARLVEAMKRGNDAVVTARSTRGATTRDTFSLLGFTAAVDEAAQRCTS